MKINLQLLLTVSAIFAALPQSSGSAPPPAEHGRKKVNVLILGAGAAGISAGKTLYDQGITDHLVLEAQDYIGGRIKQIPFGYTKIEEGANWIHFAKEEDNPLNLLREKYKLKGHMSNYSDLCMS